MILTRIHPIEEAVRSRPREIDWVLFDSSRHDRRINELRRLCREAGVPIRYGDSSALARAVGPKHQGVAARLAVRGYLEESEALAGDPGKRLLFVLDEIQDPQNLGALLRVAEGVGATVIVPERGTAPLSEAVSRSSAGAVERVAIGVVGLDPSGSDLFAVDLTGDLALVVGSEGKGIRRLVREGCDQLARLPMRGNLASLNVSTALAAAAYEAVRQRRNSPGESA